MENRFTNTYIGCKKCNALGTFEVFVRKDSVELKCVVCNTIRIMKISPEIYID